jgi:hypothetical protein
VAYFAAKKGFWIYIGTNGWLLLPDVPDRLGDAGASVFNFAVDSWDEKPSLPKAVAPVRKHPEHLLKQYSGRFASLSFTGLCKPERAAGGNRNKDAKAKSNSRGHLLRRHRSRRGELPGSGVTSSTPCRAGLSAQDPAGTFLPTSPAAYLNW